MKGKCKECGQCCNPIKTHWYKKSIIKKTYEHDFIRKNWFRISKKKAIELGETGNAIYYECKKFDKKTNKCTEYNKRPDVCRNYPFYNSEKFPKGRVDDTCGFNHKSNLEKD